VIDEVSDPTYAYDFFARSPIQSNIFLRFFLPLSKNITRKNTPQLSIIHILTFLKGQRISHRIKQGLFFLKTFISRAEARGPPTAVALLTNKKIKPFEKRTRSPVHWLMRRFSFISVGNDIGSCYDHDAA
jgi:hypothetical protein